LAVALLPMLPILAKPTLPEPPAAAAPAEDTGPDEPLLFDQRETSLQAGPPPARGLAASADGKLLAVVSGAPGHPGAVVVWDLATKKVRTRIETTTGARCVALSADGALVAVGGEKEAGVYAVADGATRGVCPGHTGPVTAVAFGPGGKDLYTASEDGTAR